MTYYFVNYVDGDWKEHFWTKNESHLKLLLDEYPHMEVDAKIYVYTDCKTDFEFFNDVLIDHNVHLSDYNEIVVFVSDHDQSVYHVITEHIREDLDTGGMTDANYQSTINNILKSVINMMTMSKFVSDDTFSTQVVKLAMKYVSRFILVEQSVISESLNIPALRYMGIIGSSDTSLPTTHDYEDLFEVVDEVMFVKMCDGMEL